MGTPNNQPEEALSTTILRSMMRNDTRQLTPQQARELGMDIDTVEIIYSKRIKPNLDILSGYVDLATMGRPKPVYQVWDSDEAWSDLLRRVGLEDTQHKVVQVFCRRLHGGTGSIPLFYIAVFVTRRIGWVVWHRYEDQWGIARGERVKVIESVREMVEYVLEIVGDDWSVQPNDRHPDCENPVMRIAFGLIDILSRTIGDRERRLQSVKNSRDGAVDDLSIIKHAR